MPIRSTGRRLDDSYGGNGGEAAGGGIRVAGGTLEIRPELDLRQRGGRRTGGGLGQSIAGWAGVSVGGGLNIAPAVPPLADLDTFTESNTINNFADIDPNIAGPYSLNGTFARTLAISDVSILEGNSGTTAFVFTVTLSAPTARPCRSTTPPPTAPPRPAATTRPPRAR